MRRIFLTDHEKTGDLGEGAVSYIAVILLVAGIVAAVVSTDLGGKVVPKIELAVCRVGSSDCPSTDAPQGTHPRRAAHRRHLGEHGHRRLPGGLPAGAE